MASENKQIHLKTRPEGVPQADHFEVITTDIPTPGDGEALCRIRYLSLDPYMRGQISGRHISGVVNPGDLLMAETVGEIVESNNSDLAVGDLLTFRGGWQQYALATGTIGSDVHAVDPRIDPPSLALGILGMPGLTAYAGLLYLGEPKEGDTLMVSASSGPVGSMVGQIGRIKGCRVIGIAGSDEKCRWCVEEAGFEACINYKTENLADAIDRHCPDGVNVYFDNVGGDTLEAVIWRLALGARVVLCGLSSQYNTAEMPPGPNPGSIIRARATVRGLVVYDHQDKKPAMLEDVLSWLQAGEIKFREDVTEGIENAPEAFARLMSGKNFGKTIVKVF